MNKFFQTKVGKHSATLHKQVFQTKDGLECSRWYTIANTRFFTFDLDAGVMVTQNVALYPLHHVTYSVTMFEVAASNGLIRRCIYKKIHYLIFDLELGVKVKQNAAQYPLYHVPYPGTSLKLLCLTSNGLRRWIYKKIHYLTSELGVKVKQNVAKYPLHRVTYSGTKFDVATSNSLGGDAFTKKYIIWPLNLALLCLTV